MAYFASYTGGHVPEAYLLISLTSLWLHNVTAVWPVPSGTVW